MGVTNGGSEGRSAAVTIGANIPGRGGMGGGPSPRGGMVGMVLGAVGLFCPSRGCGAYACGTDACGAGACGADVCGAGACGVGACRADACGVDARGTDARGVGGCGAGGADSREGNSNSFAIA